jgi:hypothetical protein
MKSDKIYLELDLFPGDRPSSIRVHPRSSAVQKSAISLYQIRFKPVNGILLSPHLTANFSNV